LRLATPEHHLTTPGITSSHAHHPRSAQGAAWASWSIRLTATTILTLLVLLLAARPASAHTELSSSVPSDGAAIARLSEVQLTFSRGIELLGDTLTVTGTNASWDGVVDAVRREDGRVVDITLSPPVPPGDWQLDWQILAEDSHPRRGVLLVTVANPAAAEIGPDGGRAPDAPYASADSPVPAPRQAPRGGLFRLLAGLSRIVMYLGLMAAAGLALFKAGPHRGEGARATGLALAAARLAMVALVASLFEVLFHVGGLAGDGAAGFLDGATWSAVLRTGLGRALAVRTVGLGLLAYGGIRRARAGLPSGPDAIKLVGAALALLSFQLVGHTASSAPELLIRTADLVHVVAAAVWVGGLLGLLLLGGSSDVDGRARTAARFSSAAIVAVIAVAVAGTTLAVITLPSLVSVLSTVYGRVLLLKLTVVAVLAAIGAHNHRTVVPAVGSPDPGVSAAALHQLKRTVAIESVLMVGVLALTAVLVSLSPR
jgi:copper transport protein